MSNNFSIHIWTSDVNMVCLPAACYLFNKFWPSIQNVKILGYQKPNFDLPENFEFISLGVQRGPKKWSNDMIDFYKNDDCDYFYSIWEDAFILKNVNPSIIDLANITIENDPNFFKFNLTADVSSRKHIVRKTFENYDLITATQDSAYRFSTQHCIWNKKLFLENLEIDQTPWDFELNNKKSMHNGLNIYSTKRQYAVYMGHLYKSGKKREKWYDCVYGINGNNTHKVGGLDNETINFIENNGWVPEI
tara:strand:- start:1999 stop:2742 length:744 start_codon:yes stop_codon:yes gene_type:complete